MTMSLKSRMKFLPRKDRLQTFRKFFKRAFHKWTRDREDIQYIRYTIMFVDKERNRRLWRPNSITEFSVSEGGDNEAATKWRASFPHHRIGLRRILWTLCRLRLQAVYVRQQGNRLAESRHRRLHTLIRRSSLYWKGYAWLWWNLVHFVMTKYEFN